MKRLQPRTEGFHDSGSLVNMVKSAWTPVKKPDAHPLALVASFVAAAGMSFGCAKIFGVNFRHEPALLVLTA